LFNAIAAGFRTTTLPSTTPAFTCPPPSEFAIYDYLNSEYFTVTYPVNGDRVLKGSADVLSLPEDGPQEILLFTENVGFLDLKFSIRHAASVTLRLTLTNLKTLKVQHPAADDAVR